MIRISRRAALGAALLTPGTVMAQEIGAAARPLRIGVTAGPHAQVMEKVREIAARPDGPGADLALRIVEFTDYIQPNLALAAGDLDAIEPAWVQLKGPHSPMRSRPL